MPKHSPPHPDRGGEDPSPAAETPGLYARLLRLLEGESFEQIAAATGETVERVRSYLVDPCDPPPLFLCIVAQRYGCSMQWLVEGKGPSGLPPPRQDQPPGQAG